MSIVNNLAYALKRGDEVPNQELAKTIALENDEIAVSELIENLSDKKKEIQSDCIKCYTR